MVKVGLVEVGLPLTDFAKRFRARLGEELCGVCVEKRYGISGRICPKLYLPDLVKSCVEFVLSSVGFRPR